MRISEVGPLATAFWRLLLAWPLLVFWDVLDRRRRPAVRQPVLAALFAWILLQEGLGPAQGLGGLLVLAGIFLARKSAG